MNVSNNLLPLLEKYYWYMTNSNVEAKTLLSLSEYEIKQLMDFDADSFYKNYVLANSSSSDPMIAVRLQNFLQIIFNQKILATGRLNDALVEFVKMTKDIQEPEKLNTMVGWMTNEINNPDYVGYKSPETESAKLFR